MNGKTVSIDLIIEKLYDQYGFRNLDKHLVAETIWDAMSIIGTPYPFEDKPVDLTIVNYKSILPVDLYSILGVREKSTGTVFREMTDLFQAFGIPAYEAGTEVEAYVDPATEETFDTYIGPEQTSEYYTFKTQGNYIFTGMDEGTIELAYKAFPIDVLTGLPTIPDNAKYIRGVVSFIGERMAFKMFLNDQLTEKKYDLIRSEYLFNVGAAISSCHGLSHAKMETMINRWKSTYLGPEHFDTGNRYLGSRE